LTVGRWPLAVAAGEMYSDYKVNLSRYFLLNKKRPTANGQQPTKLNPLPNNHV